MAVSLLFKIGLSDPCSRYTGLVFSQSEIKSSIEKYRFLIHLQEGKRRREESGDAGSYSGTCVAGLGQGE